MWSYILLLTSAVILTNPVLSKTIPIGWEIKKYEDMAANVGDVVIFNWKYYHNVFLYPANNGCDDTDSVRLGSITGTSYEFTNDDAGKDILFACNVGYHCEYGQRIKFSVNKPAIEEENAVTDECIVKFDGCNTCNRRPGSDFWACTYMYCSRYKPEYCVEYYTKEEIVVNDQCVVKHDGCNTCSRKSGSDAWACTEMFCMEHKPEYCMKYIEITPTPTPTLSPTAISTTISTKSPAKNPVTDECILKFDGCNKCKRRLGSDIWACTKMKCEKYKPEYCIEYKVEEKSPVTDQCIVKFDGCNTCTRSPGSDFWLCTKIFCIELKPEYCKEYYSEEGTPTPTLSPTAISSTISPTASPIKNPVTDKCIFKFDGCNKCKMRTGSTLWACTKMKCEKYKPEYCIEYKAEEKNLVTDQCIVKFDGCNTCTRFPGSDFWSCTEMFCKELKPEYCKEYVSTKPSTSPTAEPSTIPTAEPSSIPTTEFVETTAPPTALSPIYVPFTIDSGVTTTVVDKAMKYEIIESGYHSGIKESGGQILRSSTDFKRFWTQHTKGVYPSPRAPTVNFERHMIVIVARGEKPTGGYGIEINSIMESDSEVSVHSTTFDPCDGCMVTQALTQPFQMVKVAKSTKPAHFDIIIEMPKRTSPPTTSPSNVSIYTSFVKVNTIGTAGVGKAMKYEIIKTGYHSGIKESGGQIFQSPTEFKRFWTQHTKGVHPSPRAPTIDFKRHMIVIVARGEKPTGGYGIEINSIMESDSEVSVHSTTFDPCDGCMVTQALTQPFQMVKVAKSIKPASFEIITKQTQSITPYPIFILSFRGTLKDPINAAASIESLDTVNSVDVLQGVNMMFVHFDYDKVNPCEAKELLLQTVSAMNGAVRYMEADPPEQTWSQECDIFDTRLSTLRGQHRK